MPLMNLGNYNLSSDSSLWLQVGGRGLDTAFSYHDTSLADTGAAVRSSALNRSEIFVTSKIPCTWEPYYVANPRADIAHSLRVMGLDYVDLMLMHWTCDDGPESTARVWKVMEEMLTNGTARAIGVSNFKATDIDALMKAATIKPAVNQCQHSVGFHDDATWQRCKELGITYAAYSPLGGLENPLDVLHDPDVAAVAATHNRSTAEVALRWVVQQGVVAVTSTKKENHMLSDLAVFDADFELAEDEISRLSKVGSNMVVTVV